MEHKSVKSISDGLSDHHIIYIAVCDDEPLICDLLEEKIKGTLPDAVVHKFSSAQELLCSKDQINILFLDIQMPGMDGMEAANIFRSKWKQTLIIFVTAAPEYVFQAFDVGAFHYLVKPLSDEKFCAVFEHAVHEIKDRKKEKEEAAEEYMMIQAGGVHTKILLKDIIYAEVFNRKVVIHTVSRDVEYYGKLSDLEKKAGMDFFRTHRAYLIHFRFVQKYDAVSVTMEKGGTVLMARQNYPEFVKQYLKYNQRKGREIK